MWFLPRNRPPLFYRWCIATILCVLKPYNVPSIAGCETTSRNVLSQKCMMFWCQSTSPGRLQYSRQAGEVLVKFQFQFVPYRSVFKTQNAAHHQTKVTGFHSQTINCASSLHWDLTTIPNYVASLQPSASHPTFFYHLFSFTFYIFNFTFMAYCCLLGKKVYHRTVCIFHNKSNVLPEG